MTNCVSNYNTTMENGVIKFERPEKCIHKYIHEMQMKIFDDKKKNIKNVDDEYEEVFKYDMDACSL